MQDMAASVPPLAGRVVALKTKASNFEVRNKQVSLVQPVGFSVNFGKAEGISGSASAGSDAEKAECEISRVALELYKLLQPVLEEQLPCHLRLMGVRVSAFRDQRASLVKGQRQLSSFFQGKGSEHVRAEDIPLSEEPNLATPHDASASNISNLTSQATRGAALQAGIIDLEASSQEDQADAGRSLAVVVAENASQGCLKRVSSLASRAKRIRSSGVCCPVCGVRVPEDEANQHVNAHYGDN